MTDQSNRCHAKSARGAPCRVHPKAGEHFCSWHSQKPADRARHRAISQRGGLAKAYSALASLPPLATTTEVAALDLATATGLAQLLASTLGALARLPFDVRTATAIGQIATAQRAIVETSDVEARLRALEGLPDHERPHLHAS